MKYLILFMLILTQMAFADSDLERSLRSYTPYKEIFCLPENFETDHEIQDEIDLLKEMGQINENLCIDLNHDPTGHKEKLYSMIMKNTSSVEISAKTSKFDEYAVIYTPTSNRDGFDFRKESDYLKTSTVVLGSIIIGNLASDHFYQGQNDKYYHSRTGGLISASATAGALAAAYFVPDSRLNPKLKKLLIGCSGFVASTLAGVVKEAMDSRDRARHTVDRHDIYATSMGGGMGIGCVYSVTF